MSTMLRLCRVSDPKQNGAHLASRKRRSQFRFVVVFTQNKNPVSGPTVNAALNSLFSGTPAATTPSTTPNTTPVAAPHPAP